MPSTAFLDCSTTPECRVRECSWQALSRHCPCCRAGPHPACQQVPSLQAARQKGAGPIIASVVQQKCIMLTAAIYEEGSGQTPPLYGRLCIAMCSQQVVSACMSTGHRVQKVTGNT